ncbi:MAG: Gfo/Idh/MocA family oxidoreductase [Chloroflexota bacterium]|nr:Gfo/Idh/MocA family oxidoreductase [Chloroflexota bacterium]
MPAIKESSKRTILVSVLGVTGQAKRHIELIKTNPHAKLHHVYHPNLDRVHRSNIKNLPLTEVLEECLKSDAIIVASPTPVHFNQLQVLSRFEGLILVEKPIAENPDDLTRLSNFPSEWKSRVKVNFNFQSNPVAKKIRTVIRRGLIGQPIYGLFETNHGGAYKKDWANSWRANRINSGPLPTVGIHYIQWLVSIFGTPSSTSIQTMSAAKKSFHDSGLAQLTWNSGFVTTIATSYASAFKIHFHITGTEGYVTYDGHSVKLFSPRDTFDERGFFIQPPESLSFLSPSNISYEESMRNSQEAFINTVIENARYDPREFDRDVQITVNLMNSLNPGA